MENGFYWVEFGENVFVARLRDEEWFYGTCLIGPSQAVTPISSRLEQPEKPRRIGYYWVEIDLCQSILYYTGQKWIGIGSSKSYDVAEMKILSGPLKYHQEPA